MNGPARLVNRNPGVSIIASEPFAPLDTDRAVVRAEHLTKRFGDTLAVDDLTFALERGTVTGFLGPNGAGKTTAMRAVFGLVELDGGELLWEGRPIGLAERLRFG